MGQSTQQVLSGGWVLRAARRRDRGVVGVDTGARQRAENAEHLAGEGVELDEEVEDEGVGGEAAGDQTRMHGWA